MITKNKYFLKGNSQLCQIYTTIYFSDLWIFSLTSKVPTDVDGEGALTKWPTQKFHISPKQCLQHICVWGARKNLQNFNKFLSVSCSHMLFMSIKKIIKIPVNKAAVMRFRPGQINGVEMIQVRPDHWVWWNSLTEMLQTI